MAGIWASYVVTPNDSPRPDGALPTDAVIDGWDCWLLPALTRREIVSGRGHTPGITVTVVGDGEGYGWTRVRNQMSQFTIAPAGEGFRFDGSSVAGERFINGMGKRRVRRAQVRSALEQIWPTQLHALHGVLSSLRLARNDSFDARDFLCGHDIDDPALPAVFRSDPRPSPIRAIALDHTSPAWKRLVASQDLDDFGEPPCLVHAEVGGSFIASDPPVSLRFFDEQGDLGSTVGGIGEWVDVPLSAGADPVQFIRWARSHVGVGHEPVSPHRRPLRGEVDDEPPEIYEQYFIGWRYRLAQRPTVRMAMHRDQPDPDPAELRNWLTAATSDLHLTIAEMYERRGGVASVSAYGAWGAPNEMLLIAISPRPRNQVAETFALGTEEWQAALDVVLSGNRTLIVTAEVCDPLGFASGLRWGRCVLTVTTSPHAGVDIAIEVAQPMLDLLGSLAPLSELARIADRRLKMTIEATEGRTVRRPIELLRSP